MFAIKGTGYGLFPFLFDFANKHRTCPHRNDARILWRALARTKQNFAGWLARKASQVIFNAVIGKYSEKTRANFYVDRFLIR